MGVCLSTDWTHALARLYADIFADDPPLADTRLKELVPIWKKENWSDGSTEWVHPGTEQEKRHP